MNRKVRMNAVAIALVVVMSALFLAGCGGVVPGGGEPVAPTSIPEDFLVAGLDTDGDRLMNIAEYMLGTDLTRVDSDSDGVDDYTQFITLGSFPPPEKLRLLSRSDDADGDGLTDAEEAEYGTDPNKVDTDDDGLSDAYEALDWGGYSTNPTDPDADRDGLVDGREVWWACDPHRGDTDGDGITDSDEIDLPVGDLKKGDGCPYTAARLEGKDSDKDGIPVGAESWEVETDPRSASTDGDRYPDGMEFLGHDFYTGKDLPAYVEAAPLKPAAPDIAIEVDPRFVVNLATEVKIGNMTKEAGEDVYVVDRVEEEKHGFEAGVKTSAKATMSSNPLKNEVETTFEVYANYAYEHSQGLAQKWENKEVTAEEAYTSEVTNLSGSTLQVWFWIRNVGNDILISSLDEITLNFYMGADENPFRSETLKNTLTNIKPGDEIPCTLTVPIDYGQYQRIQAGEAVVVMVAHHSFGEDQRYLENVRARSIGVELGDGEKVEMRCYAFAPPGGLTLLEASSECGIALELSEDGSAIKGVNDKEAQAATLPYVWWTFYLNLGRQENGESIANTPLPELRLFAGDRVFLKYQVDSDGDMLPDSEERLIGTRTDQQDTDGDGLSDGDYYPELGLQGERPWCAEPLLWDTDFDGYDDKTEVDARFSPCQAGEHPGSSEGPGDAGRRSPAGCRTGYRCCEPGLQRCTLCIPNRLPQGGRPPECP